MTQNGLEPLSATLRHKLDTFLSSTSPSLLAAQKQTRASLAIINDALHRYSPEQLSLSYNGGKDCLVLLILILASSSPPSPLQAIYIAPPDPFPEVESFVAASTESYNLDLTRYALPMRSALEAYRADRPHVKAIFMGTRRTDPFCEDLAPFSPTDDGWPEYMRVNPILDWRYADIWTFIRTLDIPFCSLYKLGFSSLGGVKNTRPNPALALDGDPTKFRPAYELVRDEEERLGRDR